MTTVTIDDQLVNEIISMSHYQNAQEAIVKILADYLQQQKAKPRITDLLGMPDTTDVDFEPPHLTKLFRPADLS